jgi:hypothetical protein
MTKYTINQVSDILTIVTEDRIYQICPIQVLLRRHPPQAVVGFLELLRADYKKELGKILRENKTHPKVNHLVVLTFRLKMAINTIRNAEKNGETKEPLERSDLDDLRIRFNLPAIGLPGKRTYFLDSSEPVTESDHACHKSPI